MAIRKNKTAMIALAFCGVLLAFAIGLTAYFVPLTNSLDTKLLTAKTEITQLNGNLTERDRTISNQDNLIRSQNSTITAQNAQIGTLEGTINEQNLTIANQSGEISDLQSQVSILNHTVTEMGNQIGNLTLIVNQQAETIKNQNEEIKSLEEQIAILTNTTRPITNDVCFCFHVQNFDNQTTPLMRELNVTWIRSDWLPDYNMTNIFSQLAANNMKILCIIDANSIGTYNASTWSQAVSNIVSSPGATYVSAWEIWNEPNNPTYPFAYMNASSYYQALKTAYGIIKSHNSSQLVVSAGLAPNDTTFDPDIQYYQALYGNSDITNYMDVQGVHLYSDDAQTNLNDLNATQSIVGNETVWVTEIGIPSSPPPYDDAAQASFITSNWNLLKFKAHEVFWYEFNDEPGLLPEKESYFGVVTANDARKLSFDAVIRISG